MLLAKPYASPWRYGVVFICLYVLSSQTHSTVVDNLTIGNARALSMANSVTASPPGIDSTHFNPAGIAKLKARQYSFKFFGAHFDFKTQFGKRSGAIDDCLDNRTCAFSQTYDDPYENSKSATKQPSLMLPFVGLTEMPFKGIAAPVGGVSYSPIGSKFTIATNVFVPMGAGYRRPDGDPGQYFGREFSLVRITYLSPTIAYQFNDHWSAGFGVHASWQGMGVDLDLRVPSFATAGADTLLTQLCDSNALSTIFTVCGGSIGPYETIANIRTEISDALSLSWNMGVLWEPNAWFAWGAVYRSEGKVDLKGDYTLEYTKNWSNLFGGLFDPQRGNAATIELLNALQQVSTLDLPQGNAETGQDVKRVETGTLTSTDLVSPAHFATGVSIKLVPKLTINFDVKWSDWDSWDDIHLVFDTDQIDFLKVTALVPTQGLTGSNYLALPRNYRNVWNWSIGFEYNYSGKLTLRSGYEHRKASIPADKQGLLVPVGSGYLAGIGFTYQLKKYSAVDFAYGFYDTEEEVPAEASSNANANSLIYNPYAGLSFKNESKAHILSFNYNTFF